MYKLYKDNKFENKYVQKTEINHFKFRIKQ